MSEMNQRKEKKSAAGVAILMSTYEGGKYIEDQLRTIYSQTWPDFTLYIRDDGSGPDFTGQLKRLQDRYGFTLVLGENKGFLKSFFSLSREVFSGDRDYSYFAFADQDDLWFSNKLEESVKRLERKERDLTPDLPMVCHSAYLMVDEDELSRIREGDWKAEDISPGDSRYFYYPERGYSFRRSITENHYSGFSMTINRKMMEYMLQADPDRIDYHDWLAANIAHGFGWACFDSRPMAIHRMHKTNVTIKTLPRQIKWFARSLREESDIRRRMREYEACYAGCLSSRKRDILSLFTEDKPGHRLLKAFYPRRWRPDLPSEISMRLLMLFGRI